MSLFDAAGLVGAALILGAYAAAQLRWLDPLAFSALLANLAGASLVLLSLTERFNLGAFVMEAAWALLALYGLIRLCFTRRRGR